MPNSIRTSGKQCDRALVHLNPTVPVPMGSNSAMCPGGLLWFDGALLFFRWSWWSSWCSQPLRNYAHGSIPANSSCGSCRVLSFVFKLSPQSLYMPRVQNLAPLDVKSLTCMSESLWENSGRGNQIHNGTLAVYGMAPRFCPSKLIRLPLYLHSSNSVILSAVLAVAVDIC